MKKIIVGLLLTLLSGPLFCQGRTGYNISITISGLRDSTIYLAYHFGDKQYLRDTVTLDAMGAGVFKGSESLPQGIYMIVLPGRNYFEILISEDQQFSVSCFYNDYINTLEFKGSEENSYFISYQKKWVLMQKETASIGRRIQDNRQNSDSLKFLTTMQEKQELNKRTYLKKVISENSNNLLSVLVKSMLPVELPEFKVPAGISNPDSLKWAFRYNFNKDHFFDNFDLTDERLLRTPLLHSMLTAYFVNDPIQSADSINRKIDIIMKKSQANHNVFQYISVYLFNYYKDSEIMGHDAVMVKLADDIYLSGKADWISQEFRENLKRQIDLLRFNLIGMKAQDLVMNSYKEIFVSIYDIEKDFTILYFWEPNCGHCIEATPKLKEYYNKPKDYQVEVFAVCTTDDRTVWAKYIEQNELNWINGWDPKRSSHFDYYYNIQSTPMVYILDRNKKIIAKKLAVEDIAGFIDNYRKFFK